MTTAMELEQKKKKLEELRQQVAALEAEISSVPPAGDWQRGPFYGAYYATTGFMLGGIAALVSLLLNVAGSFVAGLHPLQIIRVYLTFPLGDKALSLAAGDTPVYAINDSMILALGCCLYIGTGMVLGTGFQYVIGRAAGSGSIVTRLIWGAMLAVAIWVVNYYLILAWLQPALFGGRWITDNTILPWWVALATHLAFGITMALLAPLGRFTPYQRPTELRA